MRQLGERRNRVLAFRAFSQGDGVVFKGYAGVRLVVRAIECVDAGTRCDQWHGERSFRNSSTGLAENAQASVEYAACLTASINVGSLLSAFELLIRLETAHRCK
jgi:hypothetical protein